MRFQIEGTYTRGAAEGPFSIQANSAEEARQQAEEMGIVVTAVIPSSALIRPRSDPAKGCRSWPQWVMVERFAMVKLVLGHAVTALAWAGVVGICLLYNEFRDARAGALWFGLFMGLLTLLAGLLLALFRLGKRLRAPHALRRLKSDGRSPVLLLRAFGDDRAGIENASPRRPWWAFTQTSDESFEEMLSGLSRARGPVIAIGRPGEILSPLGAARFWVSDETWQRVIDELIQESQLIVMVMGLTQGNDGLAWEVRRIIRSQQLAKLLLVLPPLRKEEARCRWEGFRPLCEGRLPPYQGGELAAMFANDGTCIPIRIPHPATRRARPVDADYRKALAPRISA